MSKERAGACSGTNKLGKVGKLYYKDETSMSESDAELRRHIDNVLEMCKELLKRKCDRVYNNNLSTEKVSAQLDAIIDEPFIEIPGLGVEMNSVGRFVTWQGDKHE